MSLEKASTLKLEWKLNLIKRSHFINQTVELGRKRKTSEALVTSLTSTAESENSYLP